MKNKLLECFSTIKPKLPKISEHYEIRNPVFHLSTIKHKLVESSMQYCFIKHINKEHCVSMMPDKITNRCKGHYLIV